MPSTLEEVVSLGALGAPADVESARILIKLVNKLFRERMIEVDYERKQITKLTTKFRDAGRRSPPWKPTSSRVPGRPQDGSDGNRINRWLLEPGHKYYADEITATLVEVKYYFQTLAMEGAPTFPHGTIQEAFDWLIEHSVEPGAYFDPIQLISIQLQPVMENARVIQSGHLFPLDRGGKHEPGNAFLMLARSNQLQGNLTLSELVELMEAIVVRHRG